MRQMFGQNFFTRTIALTDTHVEIRKYLFNSKIPCTYFCWIYFGRMFVSVFRTAQCCLMCSLLLLSINDFPWHQASNSSSFFSFLTDTEKILQVWWTNVFLRKTSRVRKDFFSVHKDFVFWEEKHPEVRRLTTLNVRASVSLNVTISLEPCSRRPFHKWPYSVVIQCFRSRTHISFSNAAVFLVEALFCASDSPRH